MFALSQLALSSPETESTHKISIASAGHALNLRALVREAGPIMNDGTECTRLLRICNPKSTFLQGAYCR
jgi:hypothetical protein